MLLFRIRFMTILCLYYLYRSFLYQPYYQDDTFYSLYFTNKVSICFFIPLDELNSVMTNKYANLYFRYSNLHHFGNFVIRFSLVQRQLRSHSGKSEGNADWLVQREAGIFICLSPDDRAFRSFLMTSVFLVETRGVLVRFARKVATYFPKLDYLFS